MAFTPPPAPGTPPSSTDKLNFNQRADAHVAWAVACVEWFIDTFIPEVASGKAVIEPILTGGHKWIGPQRVKSTRYDFASSISFNLADGNDFDVVCTAGAFAIANPYCDEVIVTVDDVQSVTLYQVVVNGTTYDYTSGSSATAEAISAGIVASIEAGSEPVSAADNGNGTFTITADVSGAPFSLTHSSMLYNSVQGQNGFIELDLTAADNDADFGTWFNFGNYGKPSLQTGSVLRLHYHVKNLDAGGIRMSYGGGY